jgi:hypothetical protein
MPRHQFAVDVPVPVTAVEGLLSAYPTTWLRRFLRLASLAASAHPGAPEAPGWYRLAPPIADGDGPMEFALVWWPRAGDPLFESLHGAFLVDHQADQTRLTLVGDTHGGDEDTSAKVVRSLVELIGAALRASHPPVG